MLIKIKQKNQILFGSKKNKWTQYFKNRLNQKKD